MTKKYPSDNESVRLFPLDQNTWLTHPHIDRERKILTKWSTTRKLLALSFRWQRKSSIIWGTHVHTSGQCGSDFLSLSLQLETSLQATLPLSRFERTFCSLSSLASLALFFSTLVFLSSFFSLSLLPSLLPSFLTRTCLDFSSLHPI